MQRGARGMGLCRYMENRADEILRAFPAGEAASDMLAEAARLDELGLGYPLNMMCSLYYESTDALPSFPAREEGKHSNDDSYE